MDICTTIFRSIQRFKDAIQYADDTDRDGILIFRCDDDGDGISTRRKLQIHNGLINLMIFYCSGNTTDPNKKTFS
jgi:hypothetical protein